MAGDDLLASVWTGHSSAFGAYLLRRSPGQAWTEPRRLGTVDAKHTDIASDGDEVLVAWDAYTETGNAIFVAASHDAGQTWPASRRLTRDGTSGSHPRIVNTRRGFRVFWTEFHGAEPAMWTSKLVDNLDANEGRDEH